MRAVAYLCMSTCAKAWTYTCMVICLRVYIYTHMLQISKSVCVACFYISFQHITLHHCPSFVSHIPHSTPLHCRQAYFALVETWNTELLDRQAFAAVVDEFQGFNECPGLNWQSARLIGRKLVFIVHEIDAQSKSRGSSFFGNANTGKLAGDDTDTDTSAAVAADAQSVSDGSSGNGDAVGASGKGRNGEGNGNNSDVGSGDGNGDGSGDGNGDGNGNGDGDIQAKANTKAGSMRNGSKIHEVTKDEIEKEETLRQSILLCSAFFLNCSCKMQHLAGFQKDCRDWLWLAECLFLAKRIADAEIALNTALKALNKAQLVDGSKRSLLLIQEQAREMQGEIGYNSNGNERGKRYVYS